ncbi:MAG: hypothetical protein ACE5G8_11965, partial [Anaerolineae bacterium]
MARQIIGWQKETPVPDGYRFNDFLSARNGRLYFEDLDLAQLFIGGGGQAPPPLMPSPLEI